MMNNNNKVLIYALIILFIGALITYSGDLPAENITGVVTWETNPEETAQQVKDVWDRSIERLFGATDIPWTDLLVYLAMFSIFAVAFSDIISILPWKWKKTGPIIGVSLAVIASLLGWVRAVATLLLGIVATFGAFGVVFALFVAFLVFIFIHVVLFKIALGWTVGKTKKRSLRAIEYLKEVGEKLEK